MGSARRGYRWAIAGQTPSWGGGGCRCRGAGHGAGPGHWWGSCSPAPPPRGCRDPGWETASPQWATGKREPSWSPGWSQPPCPPATHGWGNLGLAQHSLAWMSTRWVLQGWHKPWWHFGMWLGVTRPHCSVVGCLQALSSILLLQTRCLTGGIQARGWDMWGVHPGHPLSRSGTPEPSSLGAGGWGCRGGCRGPGAAVQNQRRCSRSSSRSMSADPPQTCAQKFSSDYITRSQRS